MQRRAFLKVTGASVVGLSALGGSATAATPFEDTAFVPTSNIAPDSLANNARIDEEDLDSTTFVKETATADEIIGTVQGDAGQTTTLYLTQEDGDDQDELGDFFSLSPAVYLDGEEVSYAVVEHNGKTWVRATFTLDGTVQTWEVVDEGPF
ncbi:hypothetical protein [Halorussus halobius]|uniref:hypothetical protein n=1 Tax=Halorussus halobius TaxID=1710537 RepID=UPI0010922678|nr:hypothetical protein [Halorussus halobius]